MKQESHQLAVSDSDDDDNNAVSTATFTEFQTVELRNCVICVNSGMWNINFLELYPLMLNWQSTKFLNSNCFVMLSVNLTLGSSAISL